jgi:hypothetical protein
MSDEQAPVVQSARVSGRHVHLITYSDGNVPIKANLLFHSQQDAQRFVDRVLGVSVRTAEQERADVVAWLHRRSRYWHQEADAARTTATEYGCEARASALHRNAHAIERGDHVGSAEVHVAARLKSR